MSLKEDRRSCDLPKGYAKGSCHTTMVVLVCIYTHMYSSIEMDPIHVVSHPFVKKIYDFLIIRTSVQSQKLFHRLSMLGDL